MHKKKAHMCIYDNAADGDDNNADNNEVNE